MSWQGKLRDEIADLVLKRITQRGEKHTLASLAEASVACMGAAAIVIATLPEPTRSKVIEEIAVGLYPSTQQRAKELRRDALAPGGSP